MKTDEMVDNDHLGMMGNEAKRMAILLVVSCTLRNYQGQCDNHGVDVPCSGHGSI
jgi:hypothetical protein